MINVLLPVSSNSTDHLKEVVGGLNKLDAKPIPVMHIVHQEGQVVENLDTVFCLRVQLS